MMTLYITRVMLSYHKVRVGVLNKGKEQPGPAWSSLVQPGRGDLGWAATELCLDVTTTRSMQTAEAIVAGWLSLGPGPGKLSIK